jgi:hypothetical protein
MRPILYTIIFVAVGAHQQWPNLSHWRRGSIEEDLYVAVFKVCLHALESWINRNHFAIIFNTVQKIALFVSIFDIENVVPISP